MMGHRASVHVVDPPLNQWDGVLHIDVTITRRSLNLELERVLNAVVQYEST